MPHLAAFLLVACLIVITPGPDMAMVTKNALDGGRRAALLTALGTVTGLLVWLAASAAGIVAVLRTSAVVFTVVKLCGAAYLLILGAQTLLAARRPSASVRTADGPAAENPTVHAPGSDGPATDAPAAGSLAASSPAADGRATAGPAAGRAASLRRRLRGRRPPRLLTGPPWRQGLLCNLLNPKIAVLFTSLIPQFVAPGQSAPLQAAVLAGIFVAITLVWLTGYALAASAAQQVLRRGRVQRAMRAITGTALVGLGVRLAAETR
jgi:threonine/homoserine/homoserine lactone efflux protein